MSILAQSPDLAKIIKKAVERIGENHSLARDNKGVTMMATEIEEDRKEFRDVKVIEESLKAAADEMAEKMILENTITNMVKDVMKEDHFSFDSSEEEVNQGGTIPTPKDMEEKVKLDEVTTNTIKKLVNKKLKNRISEAGKNHPGYDTYEKSIKKSKTENEKAMKDTAKKFKEYDTFNGSTNPDFPHQEDSKTDPDNIGYQYYRNNDKDQEFIDDFAHPGLIDFDIDNLNMEKLTDYLDGSAKTGNAQEDEDGELLGNVGYKSDLGEKMKKSSERRKKKIAAAKSSMTNLRGYTPDVQKVKQVKEEVTADVANMKKLWNYKKITQ